MYSSGMYCVIVQWTWIKWQTYRARAARTHIDTRQQKIMKNKSKTTTTPPPKETHAWENESERTHSVCVCVFRFFSGGYRAVVPIHLICSVFVQSITQAHTHVGREESMASKRMSPFCFDAGCFKKINTILLLYTNCELFLHRCCLTRKLWMLLPFFSLLHRSIVAARESVSVSFFGRASKETFKVLLVFFDSIFFSFAFRHVDVMYGEWILRSLLLMDFILKLSNL